MTLSPAERAVDDAFVSALILIGAVMASIGGALAWSPLALVIGGVAMVILGIALT